MVAARGARWIRTLVAPSRTWQRVPEEASKRKLLHSDEALRRAQALFRKEQQAREGEQAMAEYQAKLDAMREKTARLRALRLARDAAKRAAASRKGAA